jgi:hypothetical protein
MDEKRRLLATVRASRLLDVFTRLICISLQSPVSTDVPGLGRVETDEVYLGIEKREVRRVLVVQAKPASHAFSLVNVGQGLAMCRAKFPTLGPLAVGAQFMEPDLIAVFEFVETGSGVRVAEEKHYRLVPPDQLTAEELSWYRARLT